jgi:hypothetical protein
MIGDIGAFAPWLWVPTVLAAFLGTSAYSSELSRGAADFIWSKPLSWKKILAAKIIAGITWLTVGAVLAAVAYRIIRPEMYAQFTTLPALAIGVLRALEFTGIAFAAGLVCSTAIPGPAGGLITVLELSLCAGVSQTIWNKITGSQLPGTIWMYGWPIGLAVAFLVTARFGVTLSIKPRVWRYAAIAVACGALSVATNAALQSVPLPFNTTVRESSISPDGKHAATHTLSPTAGTLHLVRLADGKTARVGNGQMIGFSYTAYWTKDNEFVFYQDGCIRIVKMDLKGDLEKRSIALDPGARETVGIIMLSPSGDFASVYADNAIYFLDIRHARKLDVVLTDVKRRWWQSDTEIGYVDSAGKCHIVDLTKQ